MSEKEKKAWAAQLESMKATQLKEIAKSQKGIKYINQRISSGQLTLLLTGQNCHKPS